MTAAHLVSAGAAAAVASRPRTVHVMHVITGLGVGGAESMLKKLVTHAAPAGTPVRLQHSVVSLSGLGPTGAELRAAGVDVRSLDARSAADFVRAVLRLRRLVREARPHVVQGWMYHANVAVSLAARGTPVAWNIRASRLSREEKRSTRALARFGAVLARRGRPMVVTNSGEARDVHVALGYPPDRFEVIPNGFDLVRFRPDPAARAAVRRELEVDDRTRLVGMVARVHPMKDYPALVAAAARLPARHADVRFVAVGDGTDDAGGELARAVRDAGLAHRFHLLGRRTDTPAILASLDVCTLTSVAGESFPNVLGEAMACGVPCVATRVGGSAEVLGATGTIVPPSDPTALAAAWAAMLDLPDPERQALGEMARRRVADHFSMDAVLASYARLYQRMVSSDAAVE